MYYKTIGKGMSESVCEISWNNMTFGLKNVFEILGVSHKFVKNTRNKIIVEKHGNLN